MVGRLQSPTEQLAGGGWRWEGQCPLAGLSSIGEDPLPRARLVVVVGQVRQIAVWQPGRAVLERLGDLSMQLAALMPQELAIDGLPCQRVAKHKAIYRFLDDQLSGDELKELAHQLRLGMARQPREQRKVKASADNCRQR